MCFRCRRCYWKNIWPPPKTSSIWSLTSTTASIRPSDFKADDFNGIGIGRGSNNQQKSFRRAGEVFISYDFPRDADYIIRVHGWGTPLADESVRMELKLDDVPLRTFDLDADPKQPPAITSCMFPPAAIRSPPRL